jgi:hypothetical protein
MIMTTTTMHFPAPCPDGHHPTLPMAALETFIGHAILAGNITC